jgi:hypothetical protein
METRIKYRDENNELQYIPYAIGSKTTYNVEKHDDWEEEGLHDYVAYSKKPDYYINTNHPNFDDKLAQDHFLKVANKFRLLNENNLRRKITTKEDIKLMHDIIVNDTSDTIIERDHYIARNMRLTIKSRYAHYIKTGSYLGLDDCMIS